MVVMVHAFIFNTQDAGAGVYLSLRPAWSTESVPEKSEIHKETLSPKVKPQKQKRKKESKFPTDVPTGQHDAGNSSAEALPT